jgi:hypothetical protein
MFFILGMYIPCVALFMFLKLNLSYKLYIKLSKYDLDDVD